MVSEAFLRLNSTQEDSLAPHERLIPMSRGIRPSFSKTNRMTRVTQLLHELDWTIEPVNRKRSAGLPLEGKVPQGATLFHMYLPEDEDSKIPLAFNYQGLFEYYGVEGAVSLYTDGSAQVREWDQEHDRFEWSSSYSVVAGDPWLHRNYETLPDEAGLQDFHLEDAIAVAFRVQNQECHENAAYFVELAAITRAVLAVPTRVDIDIYTDSLSSIQAISRYESVDNDRRRLRTAGRPFLGLIDEVRRRRQGAVRFHHIRSHTNERDVHSAGNKVADYVADSVLRGEGQPASPWLTRNPQPLPLHLGERNVAIKDDMGRVVAGDMRRAVEQAAKAKNVLKWKDSASQGRYAGPFYKELRKEVLEKDTRADSVRRRRQLFLLNAASDTLHFTVTEVEHKRVPHERHCEACDAKWQHRSIQHLFECEALESIRDQAATRVMEQVKALLPEECHEKFDDAVLDQFDPHEYAASFATDLVGLVGKLMRQNEDNDKNAESLLNCSDVVRACFGGFLTWEMKAVLRRVAGIGRNCGDSRDNLDGDQVKLIDGQVEARIHNIRRILFDAAFEAAERWNRLV